MPATTTIANIYAESAASLIAAAPKTLNTAADFAYELHEDVVEALLSRAADLTDALTELAEARDRLLNAIDTERDAADELASHHKELQKLRRRAAKRCAARPDDADDGEAYGQVDTDDHADEREQDQLEATVIPAAAAKTAEAVRERQAAITAAQEKLRLVLTALEQFDDR